MMELEGELSWWWYAAAVVAMSLVLPLAVLQAGFKEGHCKEEKVCRTQPELQEQEEEDFKSLAASPRPGLRARGGGGRAGATRCPRSPGSLAVPQATKEVTDIRKEPWVPTFEVKEWHQACQLSGCPWNFDTCENLSDVLDRIWRQPLCKDLQGSFDSLKKCVRSVQVAKVTMVMPPTLQFAIIYNLSTGTALFGGAPFEHAVGVEVGESDLEMVPNEDTGNGLRRRRGPYISPPRRLPTLPGASQIALPCLLPFYRIHDGFGILLTTKHLPVLLGGLCDNLDGSSYYVYPVSGLEPVRGGRGNLVRFARVDRFCSACADCRKQEPSVTYVESNGQVVDDEEALISFVADTLSSIAGQRAIPPAYYGGGWLKQ